MKRHPHPLTQKELDVAGCADPDCNHDHTVLFFKQRCHPFTGLEASYDKRSGYLTLICKTCEGPVVTIDVAE